MLGRGITRQPQLQGAGGRQAEQGSGKDLNKQAMFCGA